MRFVRENRKSHSVSHSIIQAHTRTVDGRLAYVLHHFEVKEFGSGTAIIPKEDVSRWIGI